MKLKLKMCLLRYQIYYNSVKKELKSYHVGDIIEKVARSIEIIMKYVCHYYFIDVTTFYFLGDSIAKSANCGLKRGDVTVSTNMNIDTSTLTQIQISKTQAKKITSTYYAII